jgi:hypothetical protein
MASSWEQSAPPSEDLLIPFVVTNPAKQDALRIEAGIHESPAIQNLPLAYPV